MTRNKKKLKTSNLKLVIIFRLLALVCLCHPGILRAAETAVAVPVYEEPRHRLVFDKSPVKVMNVNIPPGDVSEFHFHEDPTLYIAISGALMRSQDLGKDWGDADPNARHSTGAFVFRNYRLAPQSHRVENLDQVSFRLVGIVHRGRGTPVSDPDAGAGIDNDWFYGRRFTLAPDGSTGEHLHNHPVIVVQVSDGNSNVVVQGVHAAEKTVIGNWSWHEAGVPHVLENTGTMDAELVEVEIR